MLTAFSLNDNHGNPSGKGIHGVGVAATLSSVVFGNQDSSTASKYRETLSMSSTPHNIPGPDQTVIPKQLLAATRKDAFAPNEGQKPSAAPNQPQSSHYAGSFSSENCPSDRPIFEDAALARNMAKTVQILAHQCPSWDPFRINLVASAGILALYGGQTPSTPRLDVVPSPSPQPFVREGSFNPNSSWLIADVLAGRPPQWSTRYAPPHSESLSERRVGLDVTTFDEREENDLNSLSRPNPPTNNDTIDYDDFFFFASSPREKGSEEGS
jgi:hypothetical protein